MKNRLSIAALLASAALAMGVAQPAFSADTAEPIVVAQAEGDDALRGAVEAAVAGDANLAGAAVMVDAQEGNVTLSGTVTSEDQRSAAEAAAANVEGVAGVTNDLTVAQ